MRVLGYGGVSKSGGRIKERRMLSAEEVRSVVPSGDH